MKDKRYKTVKILIGGGHITEFHQIFEHIPKTVVADDLGLHNYRITNMIESVSTIKADDIFLLSNYFDIDAKVLFELIYNQHNASKTAPRKKNKKN